MENAEETIEAGETKKGSQKFQLTGISLLKFGLFYCPFELNCFTVLSLGLVLQIQSLYVFFFP